VRFGYALFGLSVGNGAYASGRKGSRGGKHHYSVDCYSDIYKAEQVGIRDAAKDCRDVSRERHGHNRAYLWG